MKRRMKKKRKIMMMRNYDFLDAFFKMYVTGKIKVEKKNGVLNKDDKLSYWISVFAIK